MGAGPGIQRGIGSPDLRAIASLGFVGAGEPDSEEPLITDTDADRGHIRLETRNTRLTVAVGAVDAITSEWVATAELKLGLLRDRHEEKFAAIRDALERYLATYYA